MKPPSSQCPGTPKVKPSSQLALAAAEAGFSDYMDFETYEQALEQRMASLHRKEAGNLNLRNKLHIAESMLTGSVKREFLRRVANMQHYRCD